MGQQAATQRQFISDAAHQMRTPLALLAAQIQYARQRDNPDRSTKPWRGCTKAASS
jgi:two-component system sensor histidine kinase TctE